MSTSEQTADILSEQTALPNINSVRGFNVIDTVKASVESVCPGVVSCADIVALSAYFSVVMRGGPGQWVPLGRRDSFSAASNTTVLQELIGPNSLLSTVRQKIAFQNLSTTDLVALQGVGALVELYASNQTKFFEDYTQSMINMGNLNPPTETNGDIRTDCSVSNPVSSIIQEMVNVDLEPKSQETRTVQKFESAVEFFRQVVKNVAAEVAEKELVKMEEKLKKVSSGGTLPSKVLNHGSNSVMVITVKVLTT